MDAEPEDTGSSMGEVEYTPAPLQNVPAPLYRIFGESIASNAGKAYNRAMLKVQTELGALLIADRNNPFTKSRFASLGQLLATTQPVLNKNGFLLKQFSGTIRAHGGTTKRWYSSPIITLIHHVESEQWEAVVVDLPTETTVYSMASSLTFGKRYGLQSYLAIATVDDDGAAVIQNRIDETHNTRVIETAIEEVRRVKTAKDLDKWLAENLNGLNNIPDGPLLASLRAAFGERKKVLEAIKAPEAAA